MSSVRKRLKVDNYRNNVVRIKRNNVVKIIRNNVVRIIGDNIVRKKGLLL
jgi:hypothetical protein